MVFAESISGADAYFLEDVRSDSGNANTPSRQFLAASPFDLNI
jgi:hypothetical protein